MVPLPPHDFIVRQVASFGFTYLLFYSWYERQKILKRIRKSKLAHVVILRYFQLVDRVLRSCRIMEPIANLSLSESTFSIRDEDRTETLDLLEECWFFDNLLKVKPKMLRCYSDPCPSSNFSHDMYFVKTSDQLESSVSTSKLPNEDNSSSCSGLMRAPSLTTNIGREERTQEKLQSHDKRMSKLTRQLSHEKALHSIPILPPSFGNKEGTQERERDFRKKKVKGQSVEGKLQRAPSLSPYIGREDNYYGESSNTKFSHFHHHHKGISRYRPPRITDIESINTEGYKEMRRRYLNENKTKKSLCDLEIEELQGFKDLGFTFDNKDLNPSVVNIIPGLQEKKPEDLDPEKVQRPYLSEAWLVQSCAPPTPNLAITRSHEDMKAQIKFWARSVASNVRQEC